MATYMDNYTVRIGAWADVPDSCAITAVFCLDGSVELRLGQPGLDLYFTEGSARRCLERLTAALAAPAAAAVTGDEPPDS